MADQPWWADLGIAAHLEASDASGGEFSPSSDGLRVAPRRPLPCSEPMDSEQDKPPLAPRGWHPSAAAAAKLNRQSMNGRALWIRAEQDRRAGPHFM